MTRLSSSPSWVPVTAVRAGPTGALPGYGGVHDSSCMYPAVVGRLTAVDLGCVRGHDFSGRRFGGRFAWLSRSPAVDAAVFGSGREGRR
ncbi:hypothetical protein CXR04_16150 [Streptomyces sp. CMB-StM0423]|nr:hypothetical protein CXR04_16150 [Streptomyces sp. CMB-StM0423]